MQDRRQYYSDYFQQIKKDPFLYSKYKQKVKRAKAHRAEKDHFTAEQIKQVKKLIAKLHPKLLASAMNKEQLKKASTAYKELKRKEKVITEDNLN